jgi:hypothetical protein
MASGDELGETATSAPSLTPPPRADAFRAGDVLGRYAIERVLGAGGMGLVYAAHDPDLDRRVAIKVLRGDAAEESRVRLLREARAMAKLSHPNVITVYEVGTASGVDFVAMELLENGTLAEWLRAERRPLAEVLKRFRAAGAGLVAAHARGLVHRDFKPANVLLGRDGQVVVTDFGLARGFDSEVNAETLPAVTAPAAPRGAVALEDTLAAAPASSPTPRSRPGDLSTTLTRTGAVLGTPAYMAPEQFTGVGVGPAADQFAFAVAMWEGLTGARPFRGDTIEQMRAAVERGAPSAAALPRAVRPVLVRALARDPAARWPDMAALLAALDRRTRRPGRLAGIAVVLAGVAGASALVAGRGGARPPSPVAACGLTDADLAGAWSPAVRDRLAPRFAAEPRWAALVRGFDGFADAWRRERQEACAAPTAPNHHGRIACLVGLRDELAGALALLDTVPPEAIRHADAADLVPSPDVCRSGRRAAMPPLPADPAQRAALSTLIADTAQARLLAHGPRPDAAMAKVDGVVARARALAASYPPALAIALEAKASILHTTADCAAAVPVYEEAATAAEAAGADGIRAMTRLGVLECTIANSTDLPLIQRQIDQTRAAIQRAGDDKLLTAALDMTVADLDASGGEIDRAIERLVRARATLVALPDWRRAGLAALREAGYRAWRDDPGDRDATIALMQDALADYERSYGVGNVRTETLRMQLGLMLVDRDPAAGRALMTTAQAALPREPAPADAVEVRGRVVDAAGRPVAGAVVTAAAQLLAGFDGVIIPTVGAPYALATSAADGSFTLTARPAWIAAATIGDQRSAPIGLARPGLALQVRPGVSATVRTAIHAAPVAADADRAIALSRRANVFAVALVRGPTLMSLMSFARHTDDRWLFEGQAPGAATLMVFARSRLDDRVLAARPVTLAAATPLDATVDVDVDGVLVDVIVRADRGKIPTAQVFIYPDPGGALPATVAAMMDRVRAVARSNLGTAVALAPATRTAAGEPVYRPDDIHARIGAVRPGPAIACVLPFAGDIGDQSYAATLSGAADLEVRCAKVTVTDAPQQALVLEAPPMKNTP